MLDILEVLMNEDGGDFTKERTHLNSIHQEIATAKPGSIMRLMVIVTEQFREITWPATFELSPGFYDLLKSQNINREITPGKYSGGG